MVGRDSSLDVLYHVCPLHADEFEMENSEDQLVQKNFGGGNGRKI